jgi:nicotinamidase-related amidase
MQHSIHRYKTGTQLPHNPDVWIHKDRMSGLWGAKTDCEEFLEREGIKTLFFAGVNTDQCVGGTLTDAFSKGYDCVLLSDGCGTTSPGYAQECYEYNGKGTYGFVVSCEGFARGVEGMVK